MGFGAGVKSDCLDSVPPPPLSEVMAPPGSRDCRIARHGARYPNKNKKPGGRRHTGVDGEWPSGRAGAPPKTPNPTHGHLGGGFRPRGLRGWAGLCLIRWRIEHKPARAVPVASARQNPNPEGPSASHQANERAVEGTGLCLIHHHHRSIVRLTHHRTPSPLPPGEERGRNAAHTQRTAAPWLCRPGSPAAQPTAHDTRQQTADATRTWPPTGRAGCISLVGRWSYGPRWPEAPPVRWRARSLG